MTQEELQREVERVRPMLVSQAHRYLGQNVEAEDIVQDAMLKLCLLREHLRTPIDSFASVLVRNLSLNYLRRTRKMDALSDIDTVVDELAESTEDESTEQLMHIVDTLPPRQQTIIRLHDMEGMDYREISLLTGMPETALRKSASRIRWQIRLRYLAAISAAVALLIIGVTGYRSYHWQQFASRYEGSYMIVDGQRIDDLHEIRPQIEQTLAAADHMENTLTAQNLVREAEADVLQGIGDPDERRRMEELLKE